MLRLLDDRGGDPWMTMAVGRYPPARDPVDDAAAIRGMEDGAARFGDDRYVLSQAMLGEGMPDWRTAHQRRRSSRICCAVALASCPALSGASQGNRPRCRTWPW